MTTAAFLSGQIGMPLAGNASSFVEIATSASGYRPQTRPGTIQNTFYPGFGGLEVIRLAIPTSTAIGVGYVSTWDANSSYVVCPTTANLGAPIAFAISPVASNATLIQYAWFAISGLAPVFAATTIAAGAAIGISTSVAGKADTNSAGRQILGCIVKTADTVTVVKNAAVRNGSAVITVTDTAGWFVGLPISGTGIPASTTISAIDADDHRVTMSANATASGYVSVTGTYNNASTNRWAICSFNRPHLQGAVS